MVEDDPALHLWEELLQKYLKTNYYKQPKGPPTVVEGITLYNVHDSSECELQEGCTIHFPTDHHMRSWKLTWRADKGVFERMCPHGISHPDPDDARYLSISGKGALTIHGCDLCCTKPKAA